MGFTWRKNTNSNSQPIYEWKTEMICSRSDSKAERRFRKLSRAYIKLKLQKSTTPNRVKRYDTGKLRIEELQTNLT